MKNISLREFYGEIFGDNSSQLSDVLENMAPPSAKVRVFTNHNSSTASDDCGDLRATK